MNIFKKFFVGALLLVAINAQNVHAMNPGGGQNYDLSKLSKKQIIEMRLQYLQNQDNETDTAKKRAREENGDQSIAKKQKINDVPDSQPVKDLKRKQEENDDQPPSKRQKQEESVVKIEENSNVKDHNNNLNDPLWLADEKNLFSPAHIDCFSSSLLSDLQIWIFIAVLQAPGNIINMNGERVIYMSALMKRLSDLATVCKYWHNVIFSQPDDLVNILESIWVLGNCQSMNVLHYCAKRGFARASKLSLYKLAGVNVPSKGEIVSIQDTDKLFNACTKMNSSHATPILCAAEGGCLAVVDFLAKNCGKKSHIALDIPNSKGKTPLLCAAENGHYFIVAYLESRGAHFGVCDNDKKTVLHLAVLSGNKDLIRFVFNKGKNINTEGMHNQRDINNKLALHYAAQNGDLNTVYLLTADGSHKDVLTRWDDPCPLDLAITNGHIDLAQYFYGLANNPNNSSSYALDLKKQAISNCSLAMVQFLYEITGKENWDENKVELLVLAIKKKKEDMVAFLLEKFKFNTNSFNEQYKRNKRTIISYALASANEKIITLLLDAGAPVTNADFNWKPAWDFSPGLEQRLKDAMPLSEKIKDSVSECIIS